MRKLPVLFGLIFSLLLLAACSSGNQNGGISWQEVKTGFYYSEFFKNQRDFILVKMDPKYFHFSVYQNKNLEEAKTIKEIHQQEQALITFNGSFFGEDFKPVSFLKSDGKIFHKLSKANLVDGIFVFTKDDKPNLFSAESFKDSDDISFAMQNGPILLDATGKAKIVSDTGKIGSRTALGIDKDQNVVLIIIQQSLFNSSNGITLYQFADILANDPQFKGMGLHSVLNLDGGASTGMMIGSQYYPEMDKVQNVVVVKDK